jgi:TRAP-type uncharacterized transport system fused permease subunit
MGKVLVPFVFVFSPSMLIMVEGFTMESFLLATFGTIVGITALAAAFSGYLIAPLWRSERAVLAVAAMLLVAPELTITLVGLALFAPVALRPFVMARLSA